jgi:hypothetical protein
LNGKGVGETGVSPWWKYRNRKVSEHGAKRYVVQLPSGGTPKNAFRRFLVRFELY